MVMTGYEEHNCAHLQFERSVNQDKLNWMLEELSKDDTNYAYEELQVAIIVADEDWTRPVCFGNPTVAEAFAWKCKARGISVRLAEL